MNYYFSLQFTRLKRWFIEAGFNQWLGMFLGIVVFAILSKLLFYKTIYAQWIYPFLGLSILFNLGDQRRNDQLNILFNTINKIKIRILENIFVALPFLLFLLYEQLYLFSIGFAILTLLLAVINLKSNFNKVIPTPFRKIPFEYIIGFRKSILFIGLAYFLIIKSIQVDNYNLGAAAVGLLYLICMSFYLKPEQSKFVWIFTDNSKNFLKRKMIYSFICSLMLSAPGLVILIGFFSDKLLTSLLIPLIAIIFLASILVAKYSAFPKEMNLPQAILFILSFWFPPMLFIAIPIFYKQSLRNLKPILE